MRIYSFSWQFNQTFQPFLNWPSKLAWVTYPLGDRENSTFCSFDFSHWAYDFGRRAYSN